jgi:hypothetical protein
VRDTHEPESGSPGERDGRRGGEVKARGNRHGQTRAGDRDVRQPGPIDGKCHHPVPGRESVHPLAQGLDGAADFHPRYERPPGEVAGHAAPGQDIDEVQSRVLDPDGYLARPGGRLVSLGEPDNFRTAWLGDFHCSHWRLQSDRYGVRMPKLAAIWLTAVP